MPNTDPFDPARIALSLKETDSNVAQLQQQLANATQNLGSAMQSVQVDIRSIVGKMDNMTLVAARQENLEDDIERAFNAIKELAETSKEKWDEHHALESAHKETSGKEIRAQREKLILWGGVGLGFSLLAATLTGIVAWSVNSRFDNQSRDHDKLDVRVEGTRNQLYEFEKSTDKRFDNVERYLNRGGETNGETK